MIQAFQLFIKTKGKSNGYFESQIAIGIKFNQITKHSNIKDMLFWILVSHLLEFSVSRFSSDIRVVILSSKFVCKKNISQILLHSFLKWNIRSKLARVFFKSTLWDYQFFWRDSCAEFSEGIFSALHLCQVLE